MKNIILISVVVLSLIGCAKNVPTVRAPTQDLIDSFPQLEPTEPAPLETVIVPPRDDPPQGSSFYRLQLGEAAPITGFLFSDPAAAFITTEYEAISQRYELVLTNQRSRDFERLKLDTGSLRLQINADRAKIALMLRTFDLQIQDLQDIIKDQNSPFHNIWTIITVGSVGVVVGFIIGLIVAN